jgi:aerobic-type carbon monoxide dehydrogenase small subunit (CoxS/CutS family)
MPREHKKVNQGSKKSTRLTRRTFLKSMGVSSVGVAAVKGEGLVGKLRAAGIISEEKIIGPGALMAEFLVNGKKLKTEIEPQATLADVLRDHLKLTGTKIGCNRGACGACTVILDGKSASSCLTLAVDAIGLPIQTIEGLAENLDKLHPLQDAFIEHDAMQCGFCTSGMIMSSKDLLDHNPSPSDEEIKTAVSGNLCRCGTYPNVFKAVKSAAKK